MASTYQELAIDVTVDNKKAMKGLKETSKGVKGFESSFLEVAKTITGPLAAGAIAVAVIKMGKEFSGLAADAEETKNKFNSVFKEQSASVNKWADDYSAAFGRSTTDTLSYLATIQDTLVPLGFARDAAADYSKKVVELSGDLASFNHLPTADVVRDIQSAMVGNTETLRKYGVVASQAAVEQEAYNSGIWDGKGAIDAQTKAQAILQLTIKGTADAQGDLERTQNSTANTMVRLNSQWKAFGEIVGKDLNKQLTPVAATVANMLKDMNKAMKDDSSKIDAFKAAKDGTETLSQKLIVAQDELKTLNDMLEDVSDSAMRENVSVVQEEVDAQKEIVKELEKQLGQHASALAMDEHGAKIKKDEIDRLNTKAMLEKQLGQDSVDWSNKRIDLQNKLIKQINDINSEVEAGLIVQDKEGGLAAGQVEKETALRSTLNDMIVAGFNTQGVGYNKIIELGAKYNINIGDTAKILKKLSDEKDAAAVKATAFAKQELNLDNKRAKDSAELEQGYANTTIGAIKATKASIDLFKSFGAGEEADEVLDGLNKKLKELSIGNFKDSFAEATKDLKLFESTVFDSVDAITNAWGNSWDQQIQDANDTYDTLETGYDKSIKALKDSEDEKIEVKKESIMDNDALTEDEKAKLQELEDEKAAALENSNGENSDSIAAYYDKEIDDAKNATHLIQGMEQQKADAVKDKEKEKTDALKAANDKRTKDVQKAELAKFKAKKAADIANIAIDTAAAAIAALPNWIDSALITAAGIASGAAVASQPEPSFALGTEPGGFVVPPGYDNDGYKINVSSGERVDVTSRDNTNMSSGNQQPIALTMEIDGRAIGKALFNLSKDRLLTIDENSIVMV